ncbi:type ISP restriction/modification enzyme [Chloroflexus sp. MS-G]|uniref:type ISP restriction/modification enzyme n=1 Tax=Chloroflexus sp. MS-G TaxID=1521187 RepID=UPI000AC50477|nr:type ISP restriction/modification enzyme [Chloroflexus sp. MS-G]
MNRTIQITVLPKPTEAGSPDFGVRYGAYQVIGYIEAKAPDKKLDQVEESEQLQRYRHTFPNLILTNFYEFRLYRNGLELKRVTLRTAPPAGHVEEVTQLFETFFSFALPPTFTAEELARDLARRTRFLRDDVIRPELAEQVKQKRGDLYGFYKAFQKHLIAGLTEAQFADLYAQTITYGLFAARTRTQNSFNRELAYCLIPSTIGILRNVFKYISIGEPSPQMETIVDDIAAVLNAADVRAILTQYYQQGRGDDPILHFYETFLSEYDPETRERRGVYYTPQPVVRYIVRAVHDLLKTRFGMADGLADKCVTLLDPAAGTLTFPAEAVQLAFQEFTNKYGEGAKGNFLREHILPHFYAFELLVAPYAIGHMKIGFLLEELGVPLHNGERFQFYLTNALEMEDLQQIEIPGLSSLAEESHHAARIKNEEPILVIIGNPPYSGISANQNKWTEQLLKTDLDGAQSYYTVDGKPLGEKNPKWLQDDYVKFLRFAQWKIHRAGRGIVAMITNHSYLDNPTFRGMRQSLLKTFDEIYILDLHGNSLKRETAPDGSPDENVFDIRQGVAIALFVKYGNASPNAPPTREEGADATDSHPAVSSSSSPAGSLGGWQTPAAVWKYLKPLAREMRKEPTEAEDVLWQHLRGKQLGVRFRRQHAIDRFIVDFYARDPRLIIEVDGSIHETQEEYDAMRQAFLESLGYRVLRFTNEQVLQDIQGVLAVIRAVLEPHPLSPSPQAGKGNNPSPSLEQAPSSSTPSEQALPPSPRAGRGPGGGVYHAHLYGRRADKYAWLDAHDLSTAGYQPITPESPSYFFTPRQTQNLQAYQSWPSVTEIFPVNSVGIVTARDNLTIRWTPDEMWTTVLTFSQLSEELARTAFQLGKDARDWKVDLAQQDVKREGGPHREKIVPILYRPFDVRYTYYTGRSRGFHCMPRPEVMRHMLAGENLGLLVMRQVSLDEDYTHALITSHIVDNRVFASAKGIALECPLYLYPSAESPEMFHRSRQPNLADWLLPKLSAAYGFTLTPEDVLAYIYAVLYSPTYRQKYAQELRTDFPRIPFTADADLFRQMTDLGQQLIALHLLRNPANTAGVKYQGQGSDRIEHVRYNPSNGRVSINADKYFEGITPEMWEYRIGGYQVLEKYLKDRKGRQLADPIRYIHIANAINETIAMQTKIQALYPSVEQHVIPI